MGLEWTRPWALWGLALPIALVVLSLQRGEPQARFLGTLRLWGGLEEQGKGHRFRRRLPLSRLLLVAGLVAGSLALAGPRHRQTALPLRWHVVLSTHPSMFLTHTDGRGQASGQGTRIEVALAAVRTLVNQQPERPELEWSRWNGAELERILSDEPPAQWLSASNSTERSESWAAVDEPLTLWVRAQAGDLDPEHAGFVHSGGGFVPGWVGTVRQRGLHWDGQSVEEGSECESAWVQLGSGLPKDVREFAALWAEDRGLSLAEGQGRPSLHVAGTVPREDGELEPLGATARFARDGWQGWSGVGRADVGRALAPSHGRIWLSALVEDREQPLVVYKPGYVQVAMQEPFALRAGDEGAFAASWAELFDSALLPRESVVSVRDRRAAGSLQVHAPRQGERSSGPPSEPGNWTLVRWLSALAAGLVFAAALALRA